jgi:hypothetical protein
VPTAVALIYVFGFRQGKPAGYDKDLLDTCLNGQGLTPSAQSTPGIRSPPIDYVAN